MIRAGSSFVGALTDFGQPAALLLVAITHFLTDLSRGSSLSGASCFIDLRPD